MALSSLPAASQLPDLADSPFHPAPNFLFPKRTFGSKSRGCSATYFSKWTWLSYDVEADVVFCHMCVKALQSKRMTAKRADPSFVQKGFSYWKDATIAFKKHESSECHKEAVQVMISLPATCPDVGEMLSSQHAQQKMENRECLLKVLANLKFLARQGLPLRGDGDDSDSNFIQLLKLRARDDKPLAAWLEKKTDKYLSHDMQNELLQVMALSILRDVSKEIQASSFFSVMCDECTDASNKEQLVICIRWVDPQLDVHEDVIGLYKIDDISAATITHVIKDALVRLNLSWSKCRGQCYDGASNMSGPRSGVAKRIQDEEPRALYLHCHGHALNLAAGAAIKKCKLAQDALDTTAEVSKLIKFSPNREARLEKIRQELSIDSPGFRVLCPTRWTVKAASLKSVLGNYKALQQLWETSKDAVTDPTMKARIIGVESQFRTFPFFFGLHLGELVLRHSDNLSKALQATNMSAAEGAHTAEMMVRTLQSLRNEEHFDSFWSIVSQAQQSNDVDVDEPALPRKRRAPRRVDDGNAPAEFPVDCKAHYRQAYFEALDNVIMSIRERFDQRDFKIYKNLEELMLKSVRGEETAEILDQVISFYRDDFDPDQLALHLQILRCNFPPDMLTPSLCLGDIKKYFLSLPVNEHALMSEAVTLFKLLLVLPSTNAASERTFSAMRRLKTYLRATMKQSRLNHLLVLHVHKDRTDDLSCVAVARSFVGDSEHRLSVFGRFR